MPEPTMMPVISETESHLGPKATSWSRVGGRRGLSVFHAPLRGAAGVLAPDRRGEGEVLESADAARRSGSPPPAAMRSGSSRPSLNFIAENARDLSLKPTMCGKPPGDLGVGESVHAPPSGYRSSILSLRTPSVRSSLPPSARAATVAVNRHVVKVLGICRPGYQEAVTYAHGPWKIARLGAERGEQRPAWSLARRGDRGARRTRHAIDRAAAAGWSRTVVAVVDEQGSRDIKRRRFVVRRASVAASTIG